MANKKIILYLKELIDMALAAPSMVHRSGDSLVVRSVVSGDPLFGTSDNIDFDESNADVTLTPTEASNNVDDDADLPQCKIKRNYACPKCTYYTQNPRFFLHHLKDLHGEKIKIYECPSCLYASKHSQKLQRHIHMVHVMGAGKRKAKPAPAKTNTRPYNRKKPEHDADQAKENDACGGQIELADIADEQDLTLNSTADEDGKTFKCSVCSFKNRTQTVVTRHERLVHLKKKFYNCPKCKYMTHMKARYTKHVKYHSMPMIKCEMCDFRTPYKWNLDRHNKNHFGDGAFKCSLCNFTADIKQSLTVHEMNHHVPPVGQAVPSKRRNRVGASDTLGLEQEQNQQDDSARMEIDVTTTYEDQEHNQMLTTDSLSETKESVEAPFDGEPEYNTSEDDTMMKKPNALANFNSKELTVKLGEKVINPNDMLQHENGSVMIKRFKCKICDYRTVLKGDLMKHESTAHGYYGEKKKLPPRPIPNLIPIQNRGPYLTHGSVGVKTNAYKAESAPMSETDINDYYAKSFSNSCLKDFKSLIGGVDSYKTKESDYNSTVSSGGFAFPDSRKRKYETDSSVPVTEVFKKKNASFFDKLKEKLMTGVNENSSSLTCNYCGHESKCLSESNRHQKTHTGLNSNGYANVTVEKHVISGADLSSTRCQHCRHRCKTSNDLFNHLLSCPEANRNKDQDVEQQKVDTKSEFDKSEESTTKEENDMLPQHLEDKISENNEGKSQLPHPMENKIFVWNNLPERNNGDQNNSVVISSDNSSFTTTITPVRKKSPTCSPRREVQMGNVTGVESSPGYGTITSKNKSGSQGHNIPSPQKEEKKNADHSLKKVYKCPHCSFWASTASRFHVHIVGHLNKKPFECSLCAYRSNWRWDITKHIRLKTVRDASHERAKVLMTDETGRRNYSKYNKYLTLMKVHEPSAESSGSGRRTKQLANPDSTPSPSPDFLQQDQRSSSPLPALPAPPKLTPVSSNSIMQPPPSYTQLYSNLSPYQSSKLFNGSDESSAFKETPKKKASKNCYKCKKCYFRDYDKAVVLSHVKEHYRTMSAQLSNENKTDNNERALQNNSNDEGRFQQNGGESYNEQDNQSSLNSSISDSFKIYKCPLCPFFGKNENNLAEHIYLNHGEESPYNIFKCALCPYYVMEKQKLVDHMNLHNVQDLDNHIKGGTPKKSHENADTSSVKRYQCKGCPYVSNSKSQFLYHKQFHRPRGAPFKCNMCTYNVTRRHLLHQHLRVHGIHIPTQKIKESNDENMDDTLDGPVDITPFDTSNMAEIPLVWVSKLGNLTKMFKCRFCPHVNIRKSNIQEHEKRHGQNSRPGFDDSHSPTHIQAHHCPECNYVCNNAGVLSSHAKVHQGIFGQVCSLVDNSRSDETQIKELNALLGRNEEGPPIITPDEIKKEPKHLSNDFNTNTNVDMQEKSVEEDKKVLRFCHICPARFLVQKELDIHLRFHSLNLMFRCESCSYTARQHNHLLAHYKVHTDEYQDRTNTLCNLYNVSSEYPKPKIAVIVDNPSNLLPAWVVVAPPEYPRKDSEYDESLSASDDNKSCLGSENYPRGIKKQFYCDKCPAQFFKSIALQYHLTLHGGPGRHKCRSCDYAVKTYGNLIKHEAIHDQLQPRAKPKKAKKSEIAIPTSGTELFKHKTEETQRIAANVSPPSPVPVPALHIDPEFGVLMHGSPEFVYPSYYKNGRWKEKRYKCHKCPSAFEKREQYKNHLTLHGAKDRYKCEHCDYSVKYYANYIQHKRKHTEESYKGERKNTTDKSNEIGENLGEKFDIKSETNKSFAMPQSIIAGQHAAKSLGMSVADQQASMLLQQKVVGNSISSPETINRCPYCPYSNQRRDGVGSHVKCHSNSKTGPYTCKHCNYTVPQQHFLREHNKLHFSPTKGIRPEAYMKCDRLELWSEPVSNEPTPVVNNESNNNKILIFRDKGGNYKSERFHPQLSKELPSSENNVEKLYINLKSGEIENNQDSVEVKEDNKENFVMISKQEKNESVIEINENDKSSLSDLNDKSSVECDEELESENSQEESTEEKMCADSDFTDEEVDRPSEDLVSQTEDNQFDDQSNDYNKTPCDSECSTPYSSVNSGGELEIDSNNGSPLYATED